MTSQQSEADIVKGTKSIATELDLEDRIEVTAKKNEFNYIKGPQRGLL